MNKVEATLKRAIAKEGAMQAEQRGDEKRLEISRPFEIIDSDVELNSSGYTKNLSTSGMRARVDTTHSPGDLMKLEIVLADGSSPVQTQSKVIWCAPEIYGEGAEVGLKFIDENEGVDASDQPACKVGSEDTKTDIVRLGQLVTIDTGEREVKAVVDEVLIDDTGSTPQKIHINLHIVDDTVLDGSDSAVDASADNDDILEKSEDWKPHPFRDIGEWLTKYVGPVAIILMQVASVLGRLLHKASKRVWSALPKKIRHRPEELVRRLELERRIASVRSVVMAAYSIAMRLVASTRASIADWSERRRTKKRRPSPPSAAS